MNIPSSRIVEALSEAGLLREVQGDLPQHLSGIASDTRAVVPGAIFAAVKGAVRDGHEFLDQAAERGAVAAIVGEGEGVKLPAIVVNNTRKAAAVAASAAYDWPARSLRFTGVTGTNGKTTTVSIIRHLLHSEENPAASLGTLGVIVGDGDPLPGGDGLTTPGPVELQCLLRKLVDLGVRTVAMEVSSHSLDQHRVEGVTFDAAVYTNLTRDHLDYHRTMEAYFDAKARLISLLSSEGTAIVNADAAEWRALPPAPKRLSYGVRSKADVTATDVVQESNGSRGVLVANGERAKVRLPLTGSVNVYNSLAAAGAAIAFGATVEQCAARLSSLPQIPGRLEVIARDPMVLRDYAHTLMTDFRLAGGKIVMREFHDPSEFGQLPQKVVINCTGYGARALMRDNSVVPVRGQIGWLIPQPEVNYGLFYNGVSVVSRTDGIVMQQLEGGDMRGYNDDHEVVDRAEADQAVGVVAELMRRMR